MKGHLLKKPGVFYGYWILAICFFFGTAASGCGLIASSLFIKPLEAALGWSRTEIMAAPTIILLSTGLTAPFAGRLVDRYGARMVFSLGALLAGIGFVALSQMTSFWHFFVGYAVVGVGLTAVGPVTISYVVSQWFSKRRGMAIGIMSMGAGISGIAFAPFVGVYLIPHFGWSNTYLALAVITAGFIIPLSLLVIRTRPADMGLFPDGIGASEIARIAEAKASASEGLSLKIALATPAFWLIATSVTINHTHFGVWQSVVPHLIDSGFPMSLAASAISVLSAMCCCGMFFFGWLCDRIPAKYAYIIGLGFLAVGTLIFINVGAGSPVWLIWLFTVMFGFGIGSWMPTLSMLTSNTFGLAAYGAIFGTLSLFQNIGAGIGPLMAGYIYDSMGSYYWAFIIILALVLLAIPPVLVVRRPSPHTTPAA